jgi:hypothetical protein
MAAATISFFATLCFKETPFLARLARSRFRIHGVFSGYPLATSLNRPKVSI